MTQERLPLLRGRIRWQESYRSPAGGGNKPFRVPERDPAAHRAELLSQLDAIQRAAAERPEEARVPGADREIVAVRPERGFALDPSGLSDVREGARAVRQDEDTGTVVVDTSSPELKYLRRKVERYGDDDKVSAQGARASEKLVAPIAVIAPPTLDDLGGARFRDMRPDEETVQWFEVACRGGARRPAAETQNTRQQIHAALELLSRPIPVPEFELPEGVIFFLRVTVAELRTLIELTDCVYEFDLATREVRNWLVLGDRNLAIGEAQRFVLQPPEPDSPSVVILDTGVVSSHPLLREAILSSASALPNDESPEDRYGHGTKMAGVILYADLEAALRAGTFRPPLWVQSVRVLARPEEDTANEASRPFWPAVTRAAVELAESAAGGDRRRVFALAVTAELPEALRVGDATTWSRAIDYLAYNGGAGRLFCVSTGNAPIADLETIQGYPRKHLTFRLTDPAQATNAVTVGAYTDRDELPPEPQFGTFAAVAPRGGISPHTVAGGTAGHLKPDVLLEGGNVASDGALPDAQAETLITLTAGFPPAQRPVGIFCMTSSATAEAARLCGEIWRDNPDLRPATVRGLLAHSARCTEAMLEQFPSLAERHSVCGYGVPDLDEARACTRERATVIVEDEMPNLSQDEQGRDRRLVKLFRLPLPNEDLQALGDQEVELSVTLSYLAEPNGFGRRVANGLDLAPSVAVSV